MRTNIRAFLIIILFSGVICPQSRSNLEVFYGLIDSSVAQLPDDLSGINSVSISTAQNPLLYNYIFQKLSLKYNGIISVDSGFTLSFAVEKLKLNYGEIFRKSFLGEYVIEREFLLHGNYVIPVIGRAENFAFSFSDTVAYDKLNLLENDLYPFTKGEIPPEPFLPGIVEPVIAIGVAVTAVVMFFIVRSK